MSPSPDNSASRRSEVVAELKAAYSAFRGSTEPKERDPEREVANEFFWNRLAEKLAARGINPRRYVRWAYRKFRAQHHIVWVPQITSNNTLDAYLREGTQDLEMEQLYVRLQLDTVAHQLQLGRSIREVLEDPLLDVGDAVRYAIARKTEVADIAARLRRSATLDIDNEPLYAELLSGFL